MTSPGQPDNVPPAEAETTTATVVSLFMSRPELEAAVRDLKREGFTDEEIGVVMQDPAEQSSLRPDTGGQQTDPAVVGVANGSLIGGLIGLFGSLLIPGLGPLLLGGILASTLTGAGIGAATGGLIGILVGLGVSESDAKRFERGLRAGGILLTVSSSERTAQALGIIRRYGADLGAAHSVQSRSL
jgi:uncharacterized membrane protein